MSDIAIYVEGGRNSAATRAALRNGTNNLRRNLPASDKSRRTNSGKAGQPSP